jgi:hypothetical protein
MPAESIILGLVLLAFVGFQIYVITTSFKKEPEQNDQGDFILKKPVVLSLMSLLIFFWFFGGNKLILKGTLPSNPIMYLIFLALVVTTVLSARSKITYNQMGFTIFNGYTTAKEHSWTDIDDSQGPLKRGKALKLNNGKSVRIDGQYIGLKHFYEFAATYINKGQS